MMAVSPYGPVYVDPRTGSGDLLPLLQAIQVPCELATLDSADVMFLGRGEHDDPVPVGLERKRIPDLLSSLLHKRLPALQNPKLVRAYPFRWLVVEGTYRAGDDGRLLVPRRGGWDAIQVGRHVFSVDSLEAWLFTMWLRGGLPHIKTRNDEGTALLIKYLYSWFTRKCWDDHDGHLAMQDAMQEYDAVMIIPPTITEKMAAQLPGVGYKKAREVGRMFKSPLTMTTADLRTWKAIDGIGDVMGRRIVKLLQDGE